jgi:hypothetical protein
MLVLIRPDTFDIFESGVYIHTLAANDNLIDTRIVRDNELITRFDLATHTRGIKESIYA